MMMVLMKMTGMIMVVIRDGTDSVTNNDGQTKQYKNEDVLMMKTVMRLNMMVMMMLVKLNIMV